MICRGCSSGDSAFGGIVAPGGGSGATIGLRLPRAVEVVPQAMESERRAKEAESWALEPVPRVEEAETRIWELVALSREYVAWAADPLVLALKS